MSLTVYELPNTWIPDPEIFNNPRGMDYLAWKIGDDDKGAGLWAIDAVVDDPEPLEDFIPENTHYYELLKDVDTYGFRRTVLLGQNIAAIEAEFKSQVESYKQWQ